MADVACRVTVSVLLWFSLSLTGGSDSFQTTDDNTVSAAASVTGQYIYRLLLVCGGGLAHKCQPSSRDQAHHTDTSTTLQLRLTTFHEKLSYRRGTARCVVSVEIVSVAVQQCRNYLYDKYRTNRSYEVRWLQWTDA